MESTVTHSEVAHSRTMVCLTAVATCLVMLSVFGVIHSSHACRQLYAQLQVLEASRWYLQEDYGRLLLEQSTWASHHRVEQVARTEMAMVAPALQDVRVVIQ